MYDNIRLLLTYPFDNEPDRETFCNRFGLFVKDEKKGILHNKGYETLEQNKGIYIRIELPTAKRKGNISISLSLHKFYNKIVKNGYYNYDDFSFNHANKAYKELTELITIDISMAAVKAFEVGINVVTPNNPDDYMKELSCISVKAREMRIIEDLHYKEYKQYSTNKDKDKRIIYIFYNKTFEARSKTKDIEKRENIPENILRIEKDTHRPIEKLYLWQLFDPVHQKSIKCEFEQRFINDLQYTNSYIKPKELTDYQYSYWKEIQQIGTEKLKERQKKLYELNEITKRQYYFSINTINDISEKNISPQIIISKAGETLKQLIMCKLEKM